MSTFKIFVDGELFYHPSISSLAITQAEVTEDASSIDSLKLSAPQDHPYIDNIKPISSLITLKKDDLVVFQGRALDDGTDFYNTHTWTCESCLAWLKDTYQPPFDYEGPLKTMLQTFLDEHNKRVEDKKKFTLGNVTVEDDNDYVHYASSSYISTMDAIKEKLIETHGGYLVYRIKDGVNYLDYLADFTEATAQTVEYGKNLLDVTITRDHSSRVTALIPYGAVTKKATTVGEADIRLDITSVNNGSNYVFDQDAVDEIGWIWATQTWDSVTVAQNLLTKAKTRLAELKDGIISMELSIVDESDAGVDINDIHAREYVNCISAPHGINGRYLVLSKTTDFLHPSNNKISIGAKGITLSKATAEMPKQGPQGIQGPQGEKGEKGDTGATGPQGEKGDTGAQGPKGETGAAGAQGPKGETGAAGKDGTSISIKSSAVTYQISSSGTEIPTGTWKSSIPSVSAGEYLWTRTVVTYSDSTSTTSYSVSRFGKDGAKGDTGAQGPQGKTGATGAQGPKGETGAAGKDGTSVTVKSSAISYQASSSGTTVPTGTWDTAIPSVTAGEYLWTRTVVTYSDGTSTTSYSVARFGKDGAKGATGAAGKDTVSIVISSSNGTLFRNTAIATTLTATVYKGTEEITGTALSSLGTISWYLNGATTAAATGSSYSIEAGTAGENAVVVCKLGTAARSEINLAIVKDIKTYTRYYQAVTAGDKAPDQPTTDPPASAWTDTEPAYDGTDKDLYYTDLTEYTDGSFSFSAVSQSSTAAAISDLSKTVAGNSADVNALQDTIRETSDAIDTKADEIKSYVDSTYVTADDLETAKTDLQTSITETESSIRLDFQQTTDTIDNKVDTNQSNLEEYIRFNDGTIELGKVGNAFTATLSNEELAFLQNGAAVAYVSDNSMKITDAEIDRKLSLGESAKGWFDFIPRSNGNLSVKWRDS